MGKTIDSYPFSFTPAHIEESAWLFCEIFVGVGFALAVILVLYYRFLKKGDRISNGQLGLSIFFLAIEAFFLVETLKLAEPYVEFDHSAYKILQPTTEVYNVIVKWRYSKPLIKNVRIIAKSPSDFVDDCFYSVYEYVTPPYWYQEESEVQLPDYSVLIPIAVIVITICSTIDTLIHLIRKTGEVNDFRGKCGHVLSRLVETARPVETFSIDASCNIIFAILINNYHGECIGYLGDASVHLALVLANLIIIGFLFVMRIPTGCCFKFLRWTLLLALVIGNAYLVYVTYTAQWKEDKQAVGIMIVSPLLDLIGPLILELLFRPQKGVKRTAGDPRFTNESSLNTTLNSGLEMSNTHPAYGNYPGPTKTVMVMRI